MRYLLGLAALIFAGSCSAITASAYIALAEDGTVLLEHNADEVRPIASITKLFTVERAITLSPDEPIEITADDVRQGRSSRSPLRAGYIYPRQVLIELALVSSDNVAAIALGRTSPPSSNLPPNTTIVEASGLDPNNTSTARALAFAALDVPSSIALTSTLPEAHARRSTNPLLTNPAWHFRLSKTGFINPAGGCLVSVFEVDGRWVTVVILNSRPVRARWQDLALIRARLDPTYTAPRPAAKKTKKRRR